MKKIINFLNFPAIEKYILVKSAFLLGVMRLRLSLFSFKTVLTLLNRVKQKSRKAGSAYRLSPDRLAWAVERASRYVPRTTCLAKAMTTYVLLLQYGYKANLHIGVAKDRLGNLEAHAWVESQGRVVLGELKDLSRYTPFPPLKEEKP